MDQARSVSQRDLSPADLHAAVERELDALGDPSRGVTRERLADVLLDDCDDVRRIARYMWAALAVSGDELSRETVLTEVEDAVEHARCSAAAVGDGRSESLGEPEELLRLATAPAAEPAAEDSAVEGMSTAAAGVFFAQAIALVEVLAHPETDFSAGLDATLIAHDVVGDVAARESVLERARGLSPGETLMLATHCAIRLRDSRPFTAYVDALDPDELCVAVARLCARLAADDDTGQPADERVWTRVERQVAERLARIDPGPITQHDLATALLYRLTQASSNDERTGEMFGERMVEAAAIATTALALAGAGYTGT